MAEKFKYSDDQIKNYLSGIFDGSIDEHNLPEDLYGAISDYMLSGVYKGFGGNLADFEGKDLELLNELRENTYMFSAAKTYQQTFSQTDLLFNSDGEKRSMREFSQLGAQNFEKWNDAWGRTEYNTAIAQAQSASKWNEIQRNKDLLPYLTYQTVGEGLGCDICAPLDGLTAEVDDDVWNDIMPTNHFNCECIVIQDEKENVTVTPDDEKNDIVDSVTDKMSDVFKMNPGKDGYIFSPDHPYFDVAPKDREFAKENFGLPIPEFIKPLDLNDFNKYDKYKSLDKEITSFRRNDTVINSISNKNFVSLMGDTPVEGIKDFKVDMEFYRNKIGGTVEAVMDNDKYFSKIIIDKANTNQLVINHLDVKGSQHEGLGTKCFVNILNSAKENNFDEIILEAARADGYNGYYTWARFGFDFNPKYERFEKPIFDELVSTSKFKEIKESTNLKELMSTEKGRDFWKENGFQYHGIFNVEKDSQGFMDYFNKKFAE